MADDLSGLMGAMGVSNPLTTVFARAMPGATTPAAIQPATDAMAAGMTEAKTASPGASPIAGAGNAAAPAAPTTPTTPATPATPATRTPQQIAALEQQNRMRGLYDSLLQRAMMTQFNNGTNATGGANPAGTGYVNALMAAMQQPGGSRAWMEQQKQSAIPIMKQMPEWSQWGMDQYDWTDGANFGMKLPAPAPAPSAAAPAPPPLPTPQQPISPTARTPQAMKRQSIIGKRRGL